MSEITPSTRVGSTVLFENQAVRVWEMVLAPGEACEFHQHHHDHIILYPMAGSMRAKEDGDAEWPIVQEVDPGFVMHRTVGVDRLPSPHRLRNVGSESVTHYVIELLESPAHASATSDHNERGRLSRDGVPR
jgi:quercetin dioxygenase-like cupin family protein